MCQWPRGSVGTGGPRGEACLGGDAVSRQQKPGLGDAARPGAVMKGSGARDSRTRAGKLTDPGEQAAAEPAILFESLGERVGRRSEIMCWLQLSERTTTVRETVHQVTALLRRADLVQGWETAEANVNWSARASKVDLARHASEASQVL